MLYRSAGTVPSQTKERYAILQKFYHFWESRASAYLCHNEHVGQLHIHDGFVIDITSAVESWQSEHDTHKDIADQASESGQQ